VALSLKPVSNFKFVHPLDPAVNPKYHTDPSKIANYINNIGAELPDDLFDGGEGEPSIFTLEQISAAKLDTYADLQTVSQSQAYRYVFKYGVKNWSNIESHTPKFVDNDPKKGLTEECIDFFTVWTDLVQYTALAVLTISRCGG